MHAITFAIALTNTNYIQNTLRSCIQATTPTPTVIHYTCTEPITLLCPTHGLSSYWHCHAPIILHVLACTLTCTNTNYNTYPHLPYHTHIILVDTSYTYMQPYTDHSTLPSMTPHSPTYTYQPCKTKATKPEPIPAPLTTPPTRWGGGRSKVRWGMEW